MEGTSQGWGFEGNRRPERAWFSAILLVAILFVGGCVSWRPHEASSKSELERVGQQIRLKGPVPLKVGVAKVEITPAVGTPLAGYSKRRGKPSVGIRDPLYVRALVLNDGEDILVLVSADILLFPPPLAEEILDEVSEQLKIPKRAIVLAGTHTHSGLGSIADGFLYQMVFGSYQSQIVEGLKGRVIWAVRQAFDHQQPARWGVGKGNLLLRGLIENRMDPLGGVDPAVTVLLFDSMEGRPLAILANASAHPTLMDSKAFRFSADYPGEFCRLIEETYPGATCLFVNGAAGDLRPKGEIGSSPEERIGRFGRALAEGVTGLVNQISVKSNGDLAAWGWEIPLPPPQLHLGPIPIPSQIGRFIRPTSSDLNLLALDQVLFVPLSGEMTTGLGQDLRQKLEAQGLSPILVEYANGYLGYAVTPEQWSRRSYEAWMTWYGPSFGLYLVDRVQELAGLYKEKRK